MKGLVTMTWLANGLRSGIRSGRRTMVKNWPLLALLALCFAALSPGIQSGYFAEDVYHSVVFGGSMKFRNSTWWQETVLSIKVACLVGRFFPITPLYTSFAFIAFQTPWVYKLYIISVALLDLALFCVLVRQMTGRRDFAMLAGIISASLFQFRLGVDPILGFYAQIQWVVAAFFLSLICLRKFFDDQQKTRWLYLGAAFYWVCTLSYETTYSFVVIPLLMIAAARPGWRRGFEISKPYLAAVGFCGFMTAYTRWLHPSTNYVHQMNFSVKRVLLSVAHQVSSGLPLSYYLCDPRGVFGSGRGLVGWLDWLMEPMVLLIFAGMVALGYRTLQKGRRTGAEPMGPVDTPTLVALGLSLAIVPSLMTSISPHHWEYQSFGTGWIQVMIQYFGVGLLLALGTWKVVASPRFGSFGRGKCLVTAACFAAIMGITYRANRDVVLTLNAPPGSKRFQPWIGLHGSSCHMQRLHLIAAIQAGVMDEVPEGSRIIMAHQYTLWHDGARGPFFYTQQTGRRMETYPSEYPTVLPPDAPMVIVRDEVKDWQTGIVVVSPACFNPFGLPDPVGRFDKGRVFVRHPAIRPGMKKLPEFLLVGHGPIPKGMPLSTVLPDDQALRLGDDLPTIKIGQGWGVFALGTTERETEPLSLRLVTDPIQVAAWRPAAAQNRQVQLAGSAAQGDKVTR